LAEETARLRNSRVGKPSELRERTKRDFSTAQTGTFAGAKVKEKASVCFGRNDKFAVTLMTGQPGIKHGTRRNFLRAFLFRLGGEFCAGEYLEHLLFCWGIEDVARSEIFGLWIIGASDAFSGTRKIVGCVAELNSWA